MTTPRPVFTKKLTKTDVGKRGPDGKKSNQSGVGVSKKNISSFPFLDPAILNPEVRLIAVDSNGKQLDLRYIYFNGRLHGENSRNEYRITGLGPYLREHAAHIDDQFTMRLMSDGSYLLNVGSDLRIIEAADSDEDMDETPDDDPFNRVLQSIRQRRGQTKFRKILLRTYEHKCAISGHGPDDVLEAAHIEPHSISGHNSSSNGLLLRADLHTLMDASLIVINPDTLKVMIHVSLLNTPYEQFINTELSSPKTGAAPGKQFLRDRYNNTVKISPMSFLPLQTEEEAETALQAEADARGSWNETPEEDGFWIAPDRSVVEMFYFMGQSGDENDDPIRGARGLPEVSEWKNDEQTS